MTFRDYMNFLQGLLQKEIWVKFTVYLIYTPLTKTNDSFKSVLDWESGELGSSTGSGHRKAI